MPKSEDIMREFKDREGRRYANERELNRGQFMHLVVHRANFQVDEPFFGGSMVTYYAETASNPGMAVGVMLRYGTGERRYMQVLDARLADTKQEAMAIEVNL